MTTFIKYQCLQLADVVLISSGLDHYPLCLQGFKTLRRVHLSATIFWTGGAPGIRGEKVVFGAVSTAELSGSARGAAADSLGKDALQCLNNHIHHLRVGHCSTDKDIDSSVKASH